MSVSFATAHLRVPPGFEHILTGLATEVLREQPSDVVAFAADYFKTRLALRQEGKLDAEVFEKPGRVEISHSGKGESLQQQEPAKKEEQAALSVKKPELGGEREPVDEREESNDEAQDGTKEEETKRRSPQQKHQLEGDEEKEDQVKESSGDVTIQQEEEQPKGSEEKEEQVKEPSEDVAMQGQEHSNGGADEGGEEKREPAATESLSVDDQMEEHEQEEIDQTQDGSISEVTGNSGSQPQDGSQVSGTQSDEKVTPALKDQENEDLPTDQVNKEGDQGEEAGQEGEGAVEQEEAVPGDVPPSAHAIDTQVNEPSGTAANAELEEQVPNKEQDGGDSDAKDEENTKEIADDGVKEEMAEGDNGGREGDNGTDDGNAHTELET